jgi:hypothetical protein
VTVTSLCIFCAEPTSSPCGFCATCCPAISRRKNTVCEFHPPSPAEEVDFSAEFSKFTHGLQPQTSTMCAAGRTNSPVVGWGPAIPPGVTSSPGGMGGVGVGAAVDGAQGLELPTTHVAGMPGLPMPALSTIDMVPGMSVEEAAHQPPMWPLWITADTVAARATREALLWPAVKKHFHFEKLDAGDRRCAEELLTVAKLIVEFVKISEEVVEQVGLESILMYIALKLHAFLVGVQFGPAKKAEFLHRYSVPATIFAPFRSTIAAFGAPPIAGGGRPSTDRTAGAGGGKGQQKSKWGIWREKKKAMQQAEAAAAAAPGAKRPPTPSTSAQMAANKRKKGGKDSGKGQAGDGEPEE